MANGNLGFVDKRTVSTSAVGGTSVATPANYANETNMNTRLAAINAGYFTAARLAGMTVNDKVYALRQADDAGSL